MGDSVIALAEAKLPRWQRERLMRERNIAEQAAKEGKIPLRTVADAIAWGDGWAEQARRVEAQLARTQMLLFCAEVNERASELLLDAAEAEILRLRGLIE